MKHWIFDFDGTLMDTEGHFSRTLGYALNPYNITVDKAFIERIRHKPPERLLEDELPEEEAKEALKRLGEVWKEVANETKPFAGMVEALETIINAGGSLSIWTGRDLESTLYILKRQNLQDAFSKIITGSCVEVNKPGHDGLLEIRKHRNASEDEMVMVGDHHHDIEPANTLGITSIFARWKNNPEVLPEKIKPNHEFGCVQDFHGWVRSQLKGDIG